MFKLFIFKPTLTLQLLHAEKEIHVFFLSLRWPKLAISPAVGWKACQAETECVSFFFFLVCAGLKDKAKRHQPFVGVPQYQKI